MRSTFPHTEKRIIALVMVRLPIDMRESNLCNALQRSVLPKREVDTRYLIQLMQVFTARSSHDANCSREARLPELASDICAQEGDLAAALGEIIEVLVQNNKVCCGPAGRT